MRDLQRSQTAQANTTISEDTVVMKNAQTPKASLAKIELFVCLTAFLLTLLTIFGLSRRRHNSLKLRILLWAAYTLSSYLIAYTLGLMTEASFQNELLLVWAIFLMIFFGSSETYLAYNLEDCEQWRNYGWQYLIKCAGLGILLPLYGFISPMMLAVVVLFFVVVFRVTFRVQSLMMASGYGRQITFKLIADYMSSEHQLSEGDPDPIQMRGYNYVVTGETSDMSSKKLKEGEAAAQWEAPSYRKSLEITDRVITIEKVWKCQGWLLRSGGGAKDSKLKDICLSFSLYKLLCLRFGGYSLPKQAHEKVWKLIQHLYAEGNGYERAFRVVELELSFLFDLFYTNYPIIFYPGNWKAKVMELLLLVIGSLVTVRLLLQYNSDRPQDEVQLATAGGLSIDVLVTWLILMVFAGTELVQLFFMAISEWAKVLLLCMYVRTNSWQENKWMEKLIGLICRTQLLKPWERKLRQYSLLESYGYTLPRWLYNSGTAWLIDIIRDGKKQSRPAELSSEVKQAVFRSLLSNPGALENGKASLRLNKVEDELLWAYRLETQTQVIIVWHIATSICEHEMPISDSKFHVATCLSKYLAYLVVFCPKLLPDHSYETECIFGDIVSESRKLLQGCNTKDKTIQKLKEIGMTRDNTPRVINQGAQLGQQLLNVKEEKGREFVWKELAEFWAERMVYVAPSDDAEAHAEHLVMGGEFVTHLWALVSHAGIEREPLVERPTLNRSRSLPSSF